MKLFLDVVSDLWHSDLMFIILFSIVPISIGLMEVTDGVSLLFPWIACFIWMKHIEKEFDTDSDL